MDKSPLNPSQLREVFTKVSEGNQRDLKVVIPYSPPFITVGGTPCVEIVGASAGFDWDQGKLFLHPAKPLGLAGEEYELARRQVNEVTSTLAKISSVLRREDLPAEERLARAQALLPQPLRAAPLRVASSRRP